jgi:hypothetical protein
LIPAASRFAVIGLTGVVVFLTAAPIGAQGNGRFTPPGLAKKAAITSPNPTPTPTETPPQPGKRLQTVGSWLDTANVNAPGEAWMWVSTAYWRSQSLREIDAPAMGLNVGVAPRAQVGVSLPYYFLTDRSGFSSHGFGASYVMTKLGVVQNHRVNISTSPTLEILSWAAPGDRRVNLVLPVSAQTYAGALGMYGSTGYFSRGSVFGTGAVEWQARNSLTLTTTFAHSYSVVSDPTSDALGISRHRTDATAGLYVNATPAVVFFANVGRTVLPVTETSGRLSMTGGVTINVSGPAAHTPRVP